MKQKKKPQLVQKKKKRSFYNREREQSGEAASSERLVTEPEAELLLSRRHQEVPAGAKKHQISGSRKPQKGCRVCAGRAGNVAFTETGGPITMFSFSCFLAALLLAFSLCGIMNWAFCVLFRTKLSQREQTHSAQ